MAPAFSSTLLLLSLPALVFSSSASLPSLSVEVDPSSGLYNVSVDGALFYASVTAMTVCVGGDTGVPLTFVSTAPASGVDAFGAWSGVSTNWTTPAAAATITFTFQSYGPALPNVAVLRASFPDGLDTSNCGSNGAQSTRFPSFSTSAGVAGSADFLTWRGSTLPSVSVRGLGALGSNGIDSGPVLASDGGALGRTLTLSSLDNHKILAQSTCASSPAETAISSLWSAARLDQVACLSAVCAQDQVANGDYAVQRIEGYGIAAGDARLSADQSTLAIGGAAYPVIPLTFRYSEANDDNWVGTNASGPDDTYTFEGPNGLIFSTAGGAPPANTTPLLVFSRVYNATHVDWASVASAEGIAWATSNGYTQRYVAGFVYTAPPPPCGSYSLGVSAAIPAIPAGWSYSALLHSSYGGVTKGIYAWGAALQAFSGTTRAPAITLQKVGYYTGECGGWVRKGGGGQLCEGCFK